MYETDDYEKRLNTIKDGMESLIGKMDELNNTVMGLLVVSARLYDMACLSNIDKDGLDAITDLHDTGRVVSSPPSLTEWGVEFLDE